MALSVSGFPATPRYSNSSSGSMSSSNTSSTVELSVGVIESGATNSVGQGKSSVSSPRLRSLFGSGIGKGRPTGTGVSMEESTMTGGGRISPPPPSSALASGSGPTPHNTSTSAPTSSPISPISFTPSSPHSYSEEEDYYTQEYPNSLDSSVPATPRTRMRTPVTSSPRARTVSASRSPVRLGPSLTRLEIGRPTVYASASMNLNLKSKVAPPSSSIPTPSVVVEDWNASTSSGATTTSTTTDSPTTKPKRPLPPSPRQPQSRVIFPPPSSSSSGHKRTTSLSIRYQPLVVDPPPPTTINSIPESGPNAPVVTDAVSQLSASASKSRAPAVRPLPRIPIVGSSEASPSSSSASPSTSATSPPTSADPPSAKSPLSTSTSPSTSRLLPPIPRQKSPKPRTNTPSTSRPPSRSAFDGIPSSWASRPVDLNAQRPSPPPTMTRRVVPQYGLKLGAGARERARTRSASRPRQSRIGEEGNEGVRTATTRDGSVDSCTKVGGSGLGLGPKRMMPTPPPAGSRARAFSASALSCSYSRSTFNSTSIRTIPTTAPSLPQPSSPKINSIRTRPISTRGMTVPLLSPTTGLGKATRPVGLGLGVGIAVLAPSSAKDKGKQREETSPKIAAMAKLPRLATNFLPAVSPSKSMPAVCHDSAPPLPTSGDADAHVATEAEQKPLGISLKRTFSDASHIAYFDPDMDTDMDDDHTHPLSGSLSSSSFRSVESWGSRSRNQRGNGKRDREPGDTILSLEQTKAAHRKSQSLVVPATRLLHLHPSISPISISTDDSPISPLKFFVGDAQGVARGRDFDSDADLDFEGSGGEDEDEDAEGNWGAERARVGGGEDLYREVVGEAVGLAIGGEDEEEGGEEARQQGGPYVYSYEYGWGVIVDDPDLALLEGGEDVMTSGREEEARSPSPIRYARRQSGLGSRYGRSRSSESSSSSVSFGGRGCGVVQLRGDRGTGSESEGNASPMWSWRLRRSKMQKGHLWTRGGGGEGAREGDNAQGKGKESAENEAREGRSKTKKTKEKAKEKDGKKSDFPSPTATFTSSALTEPQTRTSSLERGRKKHPMRFAEAVSLALERRGVGKDKEKEREIEKVKERDTGWPNSAGPVTSAGLGSHGHGQRLEEEDGEVLDIGVPGSTACRRGEEKWGEKGRDGPKEKEKEKTISAKSSTNFLWGRKKPKLSENLTQSQSQTKAADVDPEPDIRIKHPDKGKATHNPTPSPFMWVSSSKSVVPPISPPGPGAGSRKSLRQSSSVSVGDLRQHYHRQHHRQSHTHTHSSSQLEFRDRGIELEDREHGSMCFPIPLSIPIRRGSEPVYSPVLGPGTDRQYKREGEGEDEVV